MGCLKCGRDVEEGALFCPDCLREMEKHPVRPGTPVVLPSLERAAPKKAPKRRGISPEEQIRNLKRRVRWLGIVWIVTFLIAAVLAVAFWRVLPDSQHRPGQNYTAITTPASQAESTVPSEA